MYDVDGWFKDKNDDKLRCSIEIYLDVEEHYEESVEGSNGRRYRNEKVTVDRESCSKAGE